MLKVLAHKVKSRLAVNQAARLARFAVRLEDRQIDPCQPEVVPRAPDNVGDVERAAVGQVRESVGHAGDPIDPAHAHGVQLGAPLPDPWR